MNALEKREALIESEVRKLTKVQQRILNQMRWEGYFIIIRPHEYTWWLITPKLEVVQRVNPRTVTALDPKHIRVFEMGKHGCLGRICLAHEHMHHGSVLSAVNMGIEVNRKRDAQKDKDGR